jgi:hypothetical protein
VIRNLALRGPSKPIRNVRLVLPANHWYSAAPACSAYTPMAKAMNTTLSSAKWSLRIRRQSVAPQGESRRYVRTPCWTHLGQGPANFG